MDRDCEDVAGAPGYDPQVSQSPYLEDLSGYYGYGPFWGPGYMYPRFPY